MNTNTCDAHDQPYDDCIYCANDTIQELEDKLEQFEKAFEIIRESEELKDKTIIKLIDSLYLK